MRQYIFFKKLKKVSCLLAMCVIFYFNPAFGQMIIGGNMGTHKATIALDMNAKNINNIGSVLYGSLSVTIIGSFQIGINLATVDVYSFFNVTEGMSGQTLTLPTPSVTTPGRMVIVSNIGSNSFTMHGTILGAGQHSLFMYNGSAWVPIVSASAAVNTPISSLTAAVATNTIANGNYAQTWNWNSSTTINPLTIASNSLSSGKLVNILSSSTAAASNNQTLLNIAASGTNAISGQTTYGAQIANMHGGSGTNIALQVSASGGSTNYAINATGDVKATRYLGTSGNTYNNTTSPSVFNIDMSLGNYFTLNISNFGSVTIILLNNNQPASYVFKLVTGPNNPLITWPGNFKWKGGSPPAWSNLNPTATNILDVNRTVILNIFFDGTNYYCSLSNNYN